MPELPEVEGVVRQIRPVSIGKKIEAVEVSDTIRVSKT
ncbi:MAG: DNA-formamidopyrimidine glycosylase, partial [Planococcus sp. (in: Bacteria)]|nr:DNA-formamidopyrimidine glycosylase [Planococcus sp. (in: firmicutes)]